MSLIDQAVEVAASPPKGHNEFGIESASDGVKVPDRHADQVTPLHPRDDVLAHSRSRAQLLLPPPTIVANGPNQAPDSLRVHDGSIASGVRLAIHAGLPADHVRTARVVGGTHQPALLGEPRFAIGYAPGT